MAGIEKNLYIYRSLPVNDLKHLYEFNILGYKTVPDGPIKIPRDIMMMNLRQKMAEYGYESNENYDYVVRCLQSAPGPVIRCLNIEGEAGRRKTAFATALAHALNPAHVLYHDFTQEEPPPPPAPVIKSEDEESGGKQEPPAGLFDRVMNDACAFSEAEKTILILDQLQAADFKDHIRIYDFLVQNEWRYRDTGFYANRQNLLLFLISEEALYHSLQKNSFKVWVRGASGRASAFKSADFQLGPEADQMMIVLHELFQRLRMHPTYTEYKRIIYDIQHNVHTAEDLKTSIYGWTEGIDRDRLYAEELQRFFEKAMTVIEDYIGIEEALELTAANLPQSHDV
ncbi:MAG TPA: hypothetical protein VGL10_00700 [Gammaproteobacteria bacterium]